MKLQVNRKINQEIYDHYRVISVNKKWNTLLTIRNTVRAQPRKESVAAFRILTGHDLLAEHLHRLNILSSPSCVLYGDSDSVMNWDHVKQ